MEKQPSHPDNSVDNSHLKTRDTSSIHRDALDRASSQNHLPVIALLLSLLINGILGFFLYQSNQRETDLIRKIGITTELIQTQTEKVELMEKILLEVQSRERNQNQINLTPAE